MVSYLLIMLIIICGSIALSIIFNKDIGQTILLYLFTVIITLYFLGLFISLNIAFYIVIFATILTLVITIFKKHQIKKIFKSPSLYIFLLGTLFLIFINNGKGIYMIDEYTHWGDVVYAMFQNNTLSLNIVNDDWYASYPPAISLLQYFFMKINGTFSEAILYFGYQLLGFSLFLPFISKIKFKSKLHFIIIFILALVTPFILFGSYYNTIYVDALLGMLFGFTFVYPYIYKKIGKFEIITLSCSLFILTLLKDAGIFLSIISLINLLLVINKENKKHYLLIIGICLASIVIARMSWSLALVLNEISISHESTFKISALIDVLKNQGNDVQIKDNFISNFSTNSVLTKPLNLTYFSLTMLLALIIYFIYRNEDKKNLKSVILLITGAFIYMAGLLITFLFNFSDEEALGLLSYDRYSIIYLNGVLFFVIFSLITKYQKNKEIVLVFIIILFFIPTGFLTNLIYSNTDTSRNNFVNYVSKIDGKVLIYSENYQEYEYAKYHYLLRPIKLTENCDNSCISDDKKVILKKEYDYLYIDKINENITIDDIKLEQDKWYIIKDGNLKLDKRY